MPFFALENLTCQTVTPSLPWEFNRERPSEQIRQDKKARQAWHRAKDTVWSYYSAFEGANPNQRTSKSNPPRLLHGLVPEWDLPISLERANEAIASWKIKPSYIERSLGGNLRLIFLFPRPLVIDTEDFASYLLDAAVGWLALDLLPGLDRPAFTDPMRCYCNGAIWLATGFGAISESALQAFFVSCARDFRFTPPDNALIPLDVIEKALKAKYPNFNWPGAFEPESSGSSFWIPESQSSNSAILKPEGFITFSAHANKPFYNWADLLGSDFVKNIDEAATSKATSDIWFDSKRFYRKKQGHYTAVEMTELVNYLKVDCGMKAKQIEASLSHIYNQNHVENAAPYLFKPPGLINYMSRRRLNTADTQVIQPAADKQSWGGAGKFPFLSQLLDCLFTTVLQRDWLLAWWKYFYQSGLNSEPAPGQAVFILGGVGTGKTFLSRELVGRSVGGYADAAGHLIRGGEFNSHLFEVGLWVMDDDAVSDSPAAAQNLQAVLKKSVANSSFMMNKKFQVAGMTTWSGRIIATSNLDFMSSRILGPIDPSALDKISVLRAEKVSKIKFPSRAEIEKLTAEQLPFLLRFLIDHEPPDSIARESRFGYSSYHEPSLMDQAGQTSRSSPFKEILITALEEFFLASPEASEWRGTTTKLIQLLHYNPCNEAVIRTLRLEQVARYLEAIEKEDMLKCRTETGPLNTRIWVFDRFAIAAEHTALTTSATGIFDR